MEKEQFLAILSRYLEGKATAEEEHFLYTYYKLFLADADVLALLENKEKEKLKLAIKAEIDARIDRKPEIAVRRITVWPRIVAAASVILMLSIGGYFLLHRKQPVQIAKNQLHDIAPGKNRATLTLANGQKIVLTKGLSGKLARQGNTVVSISGQSITYTGKNTTAGDHTPLQYDVLTTVRGEQSPYPLQLSDGTRVWLNAASSITFPAAFDGKDRMVKITGEAYFEVVHDAAHPFKVMVKGQTIEDLGTSFNINAYDDEPNIQATLLSGKIRLTNTSAAATLHPGQVAIVASNPSAIIVKDVDTEGAVAWKNGYFLFDRTEPLASVMRKVSRWYDVDVEYAGANVTETYVGSASRYGNVSEVLKVLQEAGDVKFKLEGKKIIVMKK